MVPGPTGTKQLDTSVLSLAVHTNVNMYAYTWIIGVLLPKKIIYVYTNMCSCVSQYMF